MLDDEPLLSEQLLTLAEWMAQYYLAPLGEVLRGMLPLMAEVRRTVYYRITDLGRDVLADELDGDSRRSQVSEQRPRRQARGKAIARKSRTWSGACWRGWPRASR